MPDEVRELRQDAATARRALREAEARIADLRKRDDVRDLEARVEAARSRAEAAEHRLAQHRAADAAGLDFRFAARLVGDTDDELLADARTFVKMTK